MNIDWVYFKKNKQKKKHTTNKQKISITLKSCHLWKTFTKLLCFLLWYDPYTIKIYFLRSICNKVKLVCHSHSDDGFHTAHCGRTAPPALHSHISVWEGSHLVGKLWISLIHFLLKINSTFKLGNASPPLISDNTNTHSHNVLMVHYSGGRKSDLDIFFIYKKQSAWHYIL